MESHETVEKKTNWNNQPHAELTHIGINTHYIYLSHLM